VSGGEKQRTAIARALAEPSTDGRSIILLLDEPFSHLDLPNRNHIRDLLLDLVREPNREGENPFACLFVTHDATDALALADTLGVMQAGKLIQVGTPTEIYHQPATAYVAQMTGPANILRAKHLPALGLATVANPDQPVCLRPEHIQLADEGVPGQVKAVLFRGGYYELMVDINRYVQLQFFTTQATIRPGQTVKLRVLTDGIWLVR
jgi:iron(III) transport system ATP-binding protein